MSWKSTPETFKDDLDAMLAGYRRQHPIRSFFAPKLQLLKNLWWVAHSSPKWAYQRWTRRFTQPEVWNFSYFLARMIRDGTRWYIDNDGGSGFPADSTHEEWMVELKVLNGYFAKYAEDDPDDWDYLGENYDRVMALLARRFRDLWD